MCIDTFKPRSSHRDRSPESSFWETEAGRAWLIRLVVAKLVGVRSQTGRRSRDTQRVFYCVFAWKRMWGAHPVPCEVSYTHVGIPPLGNGRDVGERRHRPWRDTTGHQGSRRDLFTAHDTGVHGLGHGLFVDGKGVSQRIADFDTCTMCQRPSDDVWHSIHYTW